MQVSCHRARQNSGAGKVMVIRHVAATVVTCLASNDGSEHSNHEHGPVDRAWNAGVECGRVGVWVDHEEGCLTQVGDDQRRVRHTQEAQLRSHVPLVSVLMTCASQNVGFECIRNIAQSANYRGSEVMHVDPLVSPCKPAWRR